MPSREEYRAKFQEIMDRSRLKIDDLKAEAGTVEDDRRGDYDQKISHLEERIERIQAKLDELDEQDSGLWEKLKTELESILKSMGEGLEKVSASDETDAIRTRPKE